MHRKQMAQVEVAENLTAYMVSMVANKRSGTTVLKCKKIIVKILFVLIGRQKQQSCFAESAVKISSGTSRSKKVK